MILTFPTRDLRIEETAPAGRHGYPEPAERERFELRAWSGGYAIYDRGGLICTFHGPQYDRAAKVMRLLREDCLPNEPKGVA
jgi:hypothetical protein